MLLSPRYTSVVSLFGLLSVLNSCRHYLGIDPFIRSLIGGIELRPRPPDAYAALLRELSAIGNNVNQIAHTANSRKNITGSEIDEAVKMVREAWRLVKETL